MIQGRFGEIGELFFELDLMAANGEILTVEALLDTGFTTGWLLLDIQDVEVLDWSLLESAIPMQTAQGETFFALFEGQVMFGESEYIVPIHAGVGVPEILLGLQWLRLQRLVVDFPQGILILEPRGR